VKDSFSRVTYELEYRSMSEQHNFKPHPSFKRDQILLKGIATHEQPVLVDDNNGLFAIVHPATCNAELAVL
jgi:hypothetical protein